MNQYALSVKACGFASSPKGRALGKEGKFPLKHYEETE